MNTINTSKIIALADRISVARKPLLDAMIASITAKMEDADFVAAHGEYNRRGNLHINFTFEVDDQFSIEDLASIHDDENRYIEMTLNAKFTNDDVDTHFTRHPFRREENGSVISVRQYK